MAVIKSSRNKFKVYYFFSFSLTYTDTYEPGSTFKIITSTAGIEEGIVTPNSTYYCNGSYVVQDRRIKCWKSPLSHGSQTFQECVQNSCNPAFMQIGESLGVDTFMDYMERFGFNEKTGIDLAGEAVGILHKRENMGAVELATTSFGQSFQITPLQLLRSASAIINGGRLVTPHIGIGVSDEDGDMVEYFDYGDGEQIISEETSELMKTVLESVVSDGTGNKAYLSGYRIGGKTATSEKLPRGSGKYIASFMAFAPAENPEIVVIIMIDEPQGVYYGGTVVGPLMQEFMSNALPYIGVDKVYTDYELDILEDTQVVVPNLIGMTYNDVTSLLQNSGFAFEFYGEGYIVKNQFPPEGEIINKNMTITLELCEE